MHTHTCSRDHKVIHCRIHTKTDEGAAFIKYFTEREIMFESIYDLIQYYQVHTQVYVAMAKLHVVGQPKPVCPVDQVPVDHVHSVSKSNL